MTDALIIRETETGFIVEGVPVEGSPVLTIITAGGHAVNIFGAQGELPPPAPLAQVVNLEGVNLRTGAGTNYPKIGFLAYAAVIKILAEQPDGANLWVRSAEGWCVFRYGGKTYLEWV